jgi:hypothetical protein
MAAREVPMRSRDGAWWTGLVCAAAVLAGCGGGGGGGGDPGAFLTADTKGITGDTLNSSTESPPEVPAAGAAEDIAREIEEADLYRVDGDRLYLLNAYRGLAVVDLSTRTLVGRLGLHGVPNEMFVRGARAFVLVTPAEGGAALVDVSLADPASPQETTRIALGGEYRASRIAGHVLYVATDAEMRSYDVSGALTPVDAEPLAGGVGFVHATDALWVVSGAGGWDTTTFTFVDVSDPNGAIAIRGSIALSGWVADEWKMDVYGGAFRVVLADWYDLVTTHLVTVSLADLDHPSVLGTLDLARGEQLFATRFAGDLAYVVTFERVDPLWVVDLSDPTKPTIAGSLVVPGWSTHLVALPGRLVALGIDPATWGLIASLFDVTDPASPALLDREDFGPSWTTAFQDVRALGVFESEGLVLVPVSGETNRLAVLDWAGDSLSLRGSIVVEGPALRGFPHPRGIVALSSEEVVVADAASLAVLGRVTLAEDVVDSARLPDHRLLPLLRKTQGGRLGDVDLPIVPDRCFPYGFTVAVTGWDDQGRAAVVVDFAGPTPVVSPRFDLGGAYGSWYPIGLPAWGDGIVVGGGVGFGSGDVSLTEGGRLVVHGLPGAGGGKDVVFFGTPAPSEPTTGATDAVDGFVVIDVGGSALLPPVEADGVVTGFCLDGETLVYTTGAYAASDDQGRPRMRHDLVRVDLVSRAQSAPRNVPGWVIAAAGALDYTIEERWTDGWEWTCDVVASRESPASTDVVSRLTLPQGAYDLRAAGATLYFTATTWASSGGSGGGGSGTFLAGVRPTGVVDDDPNGWWPTTSIGTVRLAASLSGGPEIESAQAFLTMLLPEDGSVLVVRDGREVVRFDVTGFDAVESWSVDVDGYPVSARADEAPATYVLALGYAGLLTAP